MKLRLIAIALAFCFSIQAEEMVELTKVPAKVITAAKAKIAGIKLIRAEVTAKDCGNLVYQLAGRVKNQGYELKITAEGKVLDVEKEGKVPIKLSELPRAVKKGIAKAVPGLKISEAEYKVKGEIKIYEVQGLVGDNKYEIVIDGSGKLRKLEADDEDDEDAEHGKADKDDDDHEGHGKADDDDDDDDDEHGKADDDDDDDEGHGKADDDDDDDEDDDD